MSLSTFKKKSVAKYSSATKISGKPPGGHWLPQGPFGFPGSTNSKMLVDGINQVGVNGFSLNGTRRSNSGVGRSMLNSKNGTSFKGIYPKGNGGHLGRYETPPPVMNAPSSKVEINGNQWEYVKPTVLGTRGMLRKKYKWAYSGQYPNNWVQPIYSGNQTDTASQGIYITNKSAANDIVNDVNNSEKYVGYHKSCGPTGCKTTTHGYTMNTMMSPYTKNLHNPRPASEQTIRVQRKCQNPRPDQKPFPYAVQTGTGVLRGGITVSRVASACNTSNTTNVPPIYPPISA